jgi:protein unc-80
LASTKLKIASTPIQFAIFKYLLLFSDRESNPEPPKRETSTVPIPPEAPKHQQRPSLISIFTGAGGQHPSSQLSSSVLHDSRSGTTPSDTMSQNTLHPPRESFSSSSTATNRDPGVSEIHGSGGTTPTPSMAPTTIVATSSNIIGGSYPHLSHSMSLQPHPLKLQQPPRLRFVSSVEFRNSSGETSTTPLSPESPIDDSSNELHKPSNSRLQRSKAQSRKTFRVKNRRNQNDPVPPSPAGQATVPTVLANEPETPPIKPPLCVADISWDSVSQTSSTSGYRDNYSLQTGFLSPDGSMGRSPSQHSLLMLFETQDEDTLI